jgi:hypothetical protein
MWESRATRSCPPCAHKAVSPTKDPSDGISTELAIVRAVGDRRALPLAYPTAARGVRVRRVHIAAARAVGCGSAALPQQPQEW